MAAIFRERRGGLYLNGIPDGADRLLPFAGFFVPALFALAFIHYLLGALAQRD